MRRSPTLAGNVALARGIHARETAPAHACCAQEIVVIVQSHQDTFLGCNEEGKVAAP
jgi:hypothetical protein